MDIWVTQNKTGLKGEFVRRNLLLLCNPNAQSSVWATPPNTCYVLRDPAMQLRRSSEDLMANDNAFRIALIVAFATFVPFGVAHRIRSMTAERLDRWQEGGFILFGLRLSALPIVAGGLAWMIDPEWVAWSSMAIPTWARWLGVVVVALVGMLVVWTFRSLGKNLTDTVVTRKEHTLVITGPYRFARHPFYVAFALVVLSVTVVMANWLILLTGIIPFGFLVARTTIEEQKLVERFGVEYQDYMRRVGRFVPRVKL